MIVWIPKSMCHLDHLLTQLGIKDSCWVLGRNVIKVYVWYLEEKATWSCSLREQNEDYYWQMMTRTLKVHPKWGTAGKAICFWGTSSRGNWEKWYCSGLALLVVLEWLPRIFVSTWSIMPSVSSRSYSCQETNGKEEKVNITKPFIKYYVICLKIWNGRKEIKYRLSFWSRDLYLDFHILLIIKVSWKIL